MKFVLPTKIDRSKRKSISIVINKDNILIKAPLRASETAIKQVLLNKQAWIEKSITKVQHKIGTQELINSKNIYLQGRPFPVEIDSSIHSLKFATDRFLVSSTSNLEKQVKVFIQNSFHKYLEQKVFSNAQKMNVFAKVKKIRLSSTKNSWGSCSSNGTIALNWKLSLIPQELANYVIIHELSHLIYMNHSQEFWSQVSQFYPKFKVAKKILKRYSLS